LKPRPKFKTWPPAQIRLLGVLPDEEIAARFHRTLESVKVTRGKLHIPKPDPKRRNWTPAEDKVLGTASDVEIGSRLHRNPGCVYQRRRQLGIPAAKRI
jgi:hypothetical protein